jgi:hypothetical protein
MPFLVRDAKPRHDSNEDACLRRQRLYQHQSNVADDRNGYGIILLAIYYPHVAAFWMFALATRLSKTSRST